MWLLLNKAFKHIQQQTLQYNLAQIVSSFFFSQSPQSESWSGAGSKIPIHFLHRVFEKFKY